jgi:hypothetical protein
MADDTTLFLNNKDDIIKSLNTFNWFESFSGLKLNLQKTKALKIGNGNVDENIPVTLVDRIKILGIYFESDKMAREIEENWSHRMDHMKHLIKEWSKRDLSIQGKVVVIKTFLISQFVYVMQSVGLPIPILRNINTHLYKFIWQKKNSNRKAFEKVKRKIMEAGYEEGGLSMTNMIDLQTYFNLQWAGRLFEATNRQNWSAIPKWHLGKLAKDNNIYYINCKQRK